MKNYKLQTKAFVGGPGGAIYCESPTNVSNCVFEECFSPDAAAVGKNVLSLFEVKCANLYDVNCESHFSNIPDCIGRKIKPNKNETKDSLDENKIYIFPDCEGLGEITGHVCPICKGNKKVIFNKRSNGIHDISYTELDKKTYLPRFNMPLELGMFLGAKRFGDEEQKKKVCLILDKEPYRYQSFISDIAGQDIQAHQNDEAETIKIVRNWLRSVSGRVTIPGGKEILRRYHLFTSELPIICKRLRLTVDEMIFNDYISTTINNQGITSV